MTITPEQIDQIKNKSSKYKTVFLTEGKFNDTDAAQISNETDVVERVYKQTISCKARRDSYMPCIFSS